MCKYVTRSKGLARYGERRACPPTGVELARQREGRAGGARDDGGHAQRRGRNCATCGREWRCQMRWARYHASSWVGCIPYRSLCQLAPPPPAPALPSLAVTLASVSLAAASMLMRASRQGGTVSTDVKLQDCRPATAETLTWAAVRLAELRERGRVPEQGREREGSPERIHGMPKKCHHVAWGAGPVRLVEAAASWYQGVPPVRIPHTWGSTWRCSR